MARIKKVWVPYFLREKEIRTVLQNLYVSVVGSNENARVLLKNEPEKIKPIMAGGSPLARECFIATIRWLRRMREFSLTPQIFLCQFLEPFRSPARFLLKVRDLQPSTTYLDGLIFRKSEPFYDRYFEDNVVTLSMIIPQLGIASSLRCRIDYAPNIEYGFYRIYGVQPLPFVNRIHPTRLKMEHTGNAVDFSNFNFLKVSFQDLQRLQRSLAFENLCEVWSAQGGYGRRLGAVCIFCGTVRSAGGNGGPYLILENPCDPNNTITLYMTEQFLRLLNTDLLGVRDIRGKPLRALGVFWYGFGSSISVPKYPEIIASEFVKDREELVADDLIGFVRMRGCVTFDELKMKYGDVDLTSLSPTLSMNDNFVSFNFSTGTVNSSIMRIFLTENIHIRTLRRKVIPSKRGQGSLLVVPEEVLDINSLQLSGLAGRINRDKSLLKCLLALIRYKDNEGVLPSTLTELRNIVPDLLPDVSEEKILWLRDLGLIAKERGKPALLTDIGIKVAYLVVREGLLPRLKNFIMAKGFVDLSEMEHELSISSSLLLKALRDLEAEGLVRCLSIDGRRCSLFWTCLGEEACTQEANKRIKLLEECILEVLGSVHHALHISEILRRVREKGENLNYYLLKIMLSWLRAREKLKERNGEMWIYPWDKRIMDFLSRNSFNIFSVEEIIEKTSLPLIEKYKIQEILKRLKRNGQVQEILEGMWIAPLPEKKDREREFRILKNQSYKYAINLLRNRSGPIKLEHLKAKLWGFLISFKHSTRLSGDSRRIINELIQEMLKNKEIRISGNLVTWLNGDHKK